MFQDTDPDTTVVGIDRETYEDFGEPETITVTVRAGDHLNTAD